MFSLLLRQRSYDFTQHLSVMDDNAHNGPHMYYVQLYKYGEHCGPNTYFTFCTCNAINRFATLAKFMSRHVCIACVSYTCFGLHTTQNSVWIHVVAVEFRLQHVFSQECVSKQYFVSRFLCSVDQNAS